MCDSLSSLLRRFNRKEWHCAAIFSNTSVRLIKGKLDSQQFSWLHFCWTSKNNVSRESWVSLFRLIHNIITPRYFSALWCVRNCIQVGCLLEVWFKLPLFRDSCGFYKKIKCMQNRYILFTGPCMYCLQVYIVYRYILLVCMNHYMIGCL